MQINSSYPVSSTLQSHLDTVIKPKDRADRVTEGELFAGVAYDRIVTRGGEASGKEYLALVKKERAAGKSLFQAARVALKKMDGVFAKTRFAGKKNAAKKGAALESKIRATAKSVCQMDENKKISDPKDTTTVAGQAASATYEEASASAQKKLDEIVAAKSGGGSDTDPTVPPELAEFAPIYKALENAEDKFQGLIDEYATASDKRRAELNYLLQDAVSTKNMLRELLSSLIKSNGDSVMAVARNIR